MITIDLKYTLICLVLIALFVLLIILAKLALNLISTLKNVDKILEDTSVVSGVASDKASQVDGIVGAIGDITGAMRGNQNLVGAITNMVKAISSAVSYFKATRDDDCLEKEEEFRRARNRK